MLDTKNNKTGLYVVWQRKVPYLTNNHMGHCLSELAEPGRSPEVEDPSQLFQVTVAEA